MLHECLSYELCTSEASGNKQCTGGACWTFTENAGSIINGKCDTSGSQKTYLKPNFWLGQRVQTQWTSAEGGDDNWYTGTVTSSVPSTNRVGIGYDDGDTWTGSGIYVHTFGT
jgi:hypothetical protein